MVDFVLVGFLDDVVVVLHNICCGYVCIDKGDILMPSKWVGVCNGDLAEWRCGCDVVFVVFNVVLVVVIVVVCCGCDDIDHGELLVVISDGLAGCHVVVVVILVV